MDPTISLGKALDRLLLRYKGYLTAKDLVNNARARGSRVSEQMLSGFRNGKPIQTNNLEVFLAELPPDLRQEYWLDLLGHDEELLTLIIYAAPLPELLSLIADRMRHEYQEQDYPRPR